MSADARTGGCQCGAVRYRAKVDPTNAYLCHCRMCQRATGGVSIAFVNLLQADCEWESGPDWYASSPIAKRPFCSACGTPLGFQFNEGSEKMDLTVGSFDDPAGFVPKHHFGAESIHEDWIDTAALPRYRTDDYPELAQRWETAGARPPS